MVIQITVNTLLTYNLNCSHPTHKSQLPNTHMPLPRQVNPCLPPRWPNMTFVQPLNMLRLLAFLSCSQPRWPFFQRHCGTDTLCPSPNCPTHIHTSLTHSTPCWVLDCGVEKWWWWGVGDYASVRLVKSLPWSFCCVTDGWEAEQACFA